MTTKEGRGVMKFVSFRDMFPEKSLIDFYDDKEYDDSELGNEYYSMDDDDDDDDDDDEEDEDEDEFQLGEEPCKVRSFDANMFGTLYNDMGHAVEDVIRSFGSSKCSGGSVNKTNAGRSMPWHGRKPVSPQKNKKTWDGVIVFVNSPLSAESDVTHSVDTAKETLEETGKEITNNNISWDDNKSDKAPTFSSFMRRAKEDIKEYNLATHSEDDAETATTSTCSKQSLEAPSLDDASSNHNSHCSSISICDVDGDGDGSGKKAGKLLRTISEQPNILGVAKSIGDGFLLRVRSSPDPSSLLTIPKTKIMRSRSFESSDLAKVAAAMNRQNLTGSVFSTNIPPKAPTCTGTSRNLCLKKNLTQIVEETESHGDLETTSLGDSAQLGQSKEDVEKHEDEVSKILLDLQQRESERKKRVTFLPCLITKAKSPRWQNPCRTPKSLIRTPRSEVVNETTENKCSHDQINTVTTNQKKSKTPAETKQQVSRNSTKRTFPRHFGRESKLGNKIRSSIGKGGKALRKLMHSRVQFPTREKPEEKEETHSVNPEECITFNNVEADMLEVASLPEEQPRIDHTSFTTTTINAEQDCVEVMASQQECPEGMIHSTNAVSPPCDEVSIHDDSETKSLTRHEISYISQDLPRLQKDADCRDKIHTVLAGVTFEVDLPADHAGIKQSRETGDTMRSSDSQKDKRVNVSARKPESETTKTAKILTGRADEFIPVKARVFIYMNPTRSTTQATKTSKSEKTGWEKRRMCKSHFVGRENDWKKNHPSKGTEKEYPADNEMMDLDEQIMRLESPESSYADSRGSLSFSFYDSMKKTSVLQVISAINSELRIMNGRSQPTRQFANRRGAL